MSGSILQHIPVIKDAFDYQDKIKVSRSSFHAYRNNLRYFDDWLTKQGYDGGNLPIKPEIIREYVQFLTENCYKLNTIKQRFYSISWLHTVNGFDDETNPIYDSKLRRIHRKIARVLAEKGISNKPHQKAPLMAEDMRKVVQQCPDTLIGKRDKALLLIDFCSALRRSEVVALTMDNVQIHHEKRMALVTIEKSKGDQYAKGQTVQVEFANNPRYCPIRAYQDWIEAAGIRQGPIFRRIRGKLSLQPEPLKAPSVNLIVKQYAEMAGYDPADFAGHSLRRGMLKTAVVKGYPIQDIKEHARHVDMATTEQYIGHTVSKKPVTRGIL